MRNLHRCRSNLKQKQKEEMSNFFQLEEFLTSSTARQRSIENLPSWEVVEHLEELADLLDDLRAAWGSGIKITSGYRNKPLNKAVGGVESSAHLRGYAADIVPSNGKFAEFAKFVEKWAENKSYDQIIIESNKKTRWIHVGLYNSQGKQRKMCFVMNV